MKKFKIIGLLLSFVFCLSVSGCSINKQESGFVDGYYTATMSDYSHGWTILLSLPQTFLIPAKCFAVGLYIYSHKMLDEDSQMTVMLGSYLEA